MLRLYSERSYAGEQAVRGGEVELIGGHRFRQADDFALGIAQLAIEDLPGVWRGVRGQHRECA
jgi:hypothetical protein